MIGDGVMGCINSFPNLNEEGRSRSVIVATDNYSSSVTINGQKPIDILQAARYGARHNVTMYGISTASVSQYSLKGDVYNPKEKLFMDAVAVSGGSFYNINNYIGGNRSFTSDIVQKILEQEAAKLTGAPEVSYNDAPEVMSVVSLASFALFAILIWRLRL